MRNLSESPRASACTMSKSSTARRILRQKGFKVLIRVLFDRLNFLVERLMSSLCVRGYHRNEVLSECILAARQFWII